MLEQVDQRRPRRRAFDRGPVADALDPVLVEQLQRVIAKARLEVGKPSLRGGVGTELVDMGGRLLGRRRNEQRGTRADAPQREPCEHQESANRHLLLRHDAADSTALRAKPVLIHLTVNWSWSDCTL